MITRRITSDPRCPQHYAYAALLCWCPIERTVWVCSVCRRTLGLAAISRESPMPKCNLMPRKLTPADMCCAGVDWRWITRAES